MQNIGKSIVSIIGKNKMASSLAIYFFGTFLIKGISIITTPIFTRILTTHDYGIISIYQTWANIFAIFIGLQLSGSIPTARVHLPTEQFSSYLRSILGLSAISFIGISLFSFLFMKPLASILQLESQLVPFLILQAFGTYSAVFYLTYTIQTKQPKNHLRFSLLKTIAVVTISIVLVLSFSTQKYMGRIIGFTVVNVFIIGWVYNKFFFHAKSKIALTDWKYALPLSLPLIIHLISNLIIGQSDRLIINKYIGFEAAAIYSVAYTIGALGLMIAEATNNVWSPWYLENTKKKKNVTISDLSKLYIFGIAIVFIAVMLAAPEILLLMAPKEYSEGIGSLIIITASIFFQFLYRFPLGYEQYSKNMKWVAVSTIISAIVNLLLNYFFIPKWGIIGAAIATYISYVLLFFLHEFVARKIIGGYNIEFFNYVPGIIAVNLLAIFSFLFVGNWQFRYALLVILFLILISYFLKNKNNDIFKVVKIS